MSNFRLETTTFTSGGSMDENGRCQIVKRFLYNIIDNSEENRRRATLDLEKLVPVKGSCMSDDARYIMKSAAWNCLDWRNQSTKFYIDATYRRVSDDDEASAPWNLAPFNISDNAVEQEIPFRLAYNSKNKLCVPVVNSAGDPIDATTREIIEQFTFSFYAETYDIENVHEYSNSVNKTAERILGKKYPAGTLFLMPFTVSPLLTYEDDGYTEKWKYFLINMTIRYRAEGWERVLLDIGNRARFDSNAPELIYQYYPFNGSAFEKRPVWCDAKTYHQENIKYKEKLNGNAELKKRLPAHLPYEYGENLPLTSAGKVDTSLLSKDIAKKDYEGYPNRRFNEFKTMNWSGLDIPSEIKKRWRT